jgi:hypothetical protein
MIQMKYISVLFILLFSKSALVNFVTNEKIQIFNYGSTFEIEGTYYLCKEKRNNRPRMYEYIKLNSDSTAEYSFWADIIVKIKQHMDFTW